MLLAVPQISRRSSVTEASIFGKIGKSATTGYDRAVDERTTTSSNDEQRAQTGAIVAPAACESTVGRRLDLRNFLLGESFRLCARQRGAADEIYSQAA